MSAHNMYFVIVQIYVLETSTQVFLPQPKKINLEITSLVFQE